MLFQQSTPVCPRKNSTLLFSTRQAYARTIQRAKSFPDIFPENKLLDASVERRADRLQTSRSGSPEATSLRDGCESLDEEKIVAR